MPERDPDAADGHGRRACATLIAVIRSGIGQSSRLNAGDAAREAVDRAHAGLAGRPVHAALVAATAAWGSRELPALVEAVADRLACPAWAGSTVDGLFAASGEILHAPGLAVLALSGVTADAALGEHLAGEEARLADELEARLPGPPAAGDLAVVFADSVGLAPAPLVAALAAALPGAAVVGVGASEPAGAAPRVWADGDLASEACAVLRLRSRRPPRIAVTSGCRLLGPPYRVTRAAGTWLLALDERPALDCLREIWGDGGGAAPPRGALVAIDTAAGPGLEGGRDVTGGARGQVLRNVVGVDPSRGAIAVAEPLTRGTRVAFACLDEETARRDLLEQVGGLEAARPAFALQLSCRSRGAALFGEPGAEGALLIQALGGGVPVLGMMGAYQLASARPPGGPVLLHTYTSVLALVEA